MLPLKGQLRAIIHQLTMETQLNVEPSSATDLRSRILKLPTPEVIEKMSRNELDHLQNRIENLLFDLDKSSNFRSKDRSLRDTSKKGIPPYRQPLLANKVSFKCPSCQRVYDNGKWETQDTTEGTFVDRYCPYCKNNKNIKSHNNWYNSYKNN
jgi:rubredoxin